ncbi:hypothetical protein J2W96_006336 [Variovorax guangxiensis]|nr:hypothetical protein [Variovorax guangxiensis]
MIAHDALKDRMVDFHGRALGAAFGRWVAKYS